MRNSLEDKGSSILGMDYMIKLIVTKEYKLQTLPFADVKGDCQREKVDWKHHDDKDT
jgi:hypothetical protein